jgi:hypothetical protein
MYDDDGNPTWYFSAGPMSTPTRYEGEVLLFANGQALNGPYRAPTSGAIGRMTIDFAAPDDATITIMDGASEKSSATRARNFTRSTGTKKAKPQIPRFIFAPEDQWPRWNGTARVALTEITEAGTTGTYTSREIWTYSLQWNRKADRPPKGALAWYTLDSASRVVYDLTTEDTSNGCKDSALQSFGGLEGTLVIRNDLTYGFDVRGPVYLSATMHSHCDDGKGNVSNSQYETHPVIELVRPVASGIHILDMNSYRLRTASTLPPRMHGVHVNPTYSWDLLASP